MFPTGNAHLSAWTDWNKTGLRRHQILVPDVWSRFVTGILAVWVTLAWPYIFELAIWGLGKLLLVLERCLGFRGPRIRLEDGDQTVNNGGRSPPESGRTTIFAFLRALTHGQVESWGEVSIMGVASLIIILLFAGQAAAGYFTALVASDGIGLSASKHCGIWQFDPKAGDEAADMDDLTNYKKEAQSGLYARNCYGSRQNDNPFSCGLFYNESLKFTTKTGQMCPFQDPQMCLDGWYSAIAFDTGLIDASTIGINHHSRHKFRRSTVCSPLKTSDDLIRKVNDTSNTYRYFYGRKDKVNFTLETSGQPFKWLVPVYSVK